ncbi:MAG: hypothetical protein K0Q50_1785 [Vampirovibrio sp.]|jgi:hypothetical protein|nr:hypothetical protein [Vampirovibrio sp.]
MKKMMSKGNTLAEYGLCISLLALASVAGLKLMGNSISATITDLPGAPGVMQMMRLDFSGSPTAGGSVKLQGGGYYFQTINSSTGEIEFQITDSGNGSVSNATSLEGTQWNTLGQFQIAETLMQLAEKQTSAENKAFIMSLAEKSYYMGAAEGEIDAVQQLQWHDPANGDYGKLNGLVDIKRLQTDIISLLNNPPSGIDQQTLVQVNALSLDVYNIGQTYVNALSTVSENSKYSFTLSSELATGAGNGKPGQSLGEGGAQVSYCMDTTCGKPQSQGGPQVEDAFTLDYLRTVSKEVMSDAGVVPEPVVATFSNASQTDSVAVN